MNIIAPVFRPGAEVSPQIEDMVRNLMLRERGVAPGQCVRQRLPACAPPPVKVNISAPAKSNPVTIRGVKYPSFSEAGRSLGVCHSVVSRAFARGQGDLDRVGLRRTKGQGVPVIIHGVEYPTVKAAAEAYGVTGATIVTRRIRGTLDKFQKPGVS